MHQRARAHRAGLYCNKQLTLTQTVIPKPSTGLAQSDDLRVCGRIIVLKVAIAGTADDLAVANHDCANWDLALLLRNCCLSQGFAHELIVRHGTWVRHCAAPGK